MKKILCLTILMLVALSGCSTMRNTIDEEATSNQMEKDSKEKLYITFEDVGQADCILIEKGDIDILIDGGDRNYAKNIDSNGNNIMGREVDDLELIIATHPHSDHIGALDEIIENYKVERIMMSNAAHTSKSYEELITSIYRTETPCFFVKTKYGDSDKNEIFESFKEALKNKNVDFKYKKVGDTLTYEDINITILSPSEKEQDNLNNTSIGIKVNYGDTNFILLGDAEKESEDEILSLGFNLEANLFKASHHGSETSNQRKLLEEIQPDFVVISVGKDNEYGHPNQEIINQFLSFNSNVLRTDINGRLQFVSDGKKVERME